MLKIKNINGVYWKPGMDWNGMEWNIKYSMEYEKHGMEYEKHGMEYEKHGIEYE